MSQKEKHVHLICNAHLDPVWLWEMDEGIAEALSTFRIAAELCETHEGFVFNHNEALLYQWVLEHDPDLFAKIQRLVQEGKWHIMGGWFLQPDCNMPSGEALVRQILVGRAFFSKHFGKNPTTAINFDPFGHSRGLVQILAGSGYDSYVFTRPIAYFIQLPDDIFTWVGYDGSTVTGIRRGVYNSLLGKARELIEKTMQKESGRTVLPILWGIGNHGGGPSKLDLQMIDALIQEQIGTVSISHSTPEAFHTDLTGRTDVSQLPRWEGDLNPWAPGCYTSQIRIKQRYRKLENLYFSLERMAVHAEILVQMAYPWEELHDAQQDLLIAQFHDILPGSSIE